MVDAPVDADDLRDLLAEMLGDVPVGSWIKLVVDFQRDHSNCVTVLCIRVAFAPTERDKNGVRYRQNARGVSYDLAISDKERIALADHQVKPYLLKNIKTCLWRMQEHIWLLDPRKGSPYGSLPKCPWFDPPETIVQDCVLCGELLPVGIPGAEKHVVWGTAVIGWVHKRCL